ncbi:enoyl-CoA hydratase/isomerase family protein, partial [Thermodesulfobacteriota bacterium]
IIGLNKLVIHANSGCVISLFLSVSLACDYRIIASNTVFQNPFLRLGLTPIGGGAFFLSKLIGSSKAYKILLSGNDITADEALSLGIVDEVVPTDSLEASALDAARRFAEKPARSLAAVKKLINFSMKDISEYMDIEHQELIRIVESHDYLNAVTENIP